MWKPRAVAIEPVGLNVPVFGSYSSAEARAWSLTSFTPPAIRTRPSLSRVAVWSSRVVASEPVGLNVPVFGSYSSAEARNVPRAKTQLGDAASGDQDATVGEQGRGVQAAGVRQRAGLAERVRCGVVERRPTRVDRRRGRSPRQRGHGRRRGAWRCGSVARPDRSVRAAIGVGVGVGVAAGVGGVGAGWSSASRASGPGPRPRRLSGLSRKNAPPTATHADDGGRGDAGGHGHGLEPPRHAQTRRCRVWSIWSRAASITRSASSSWPSTKKAPRRRSSSRWLVIGVVLRPPRRGARRPRWPRASPGGRSGVGSWPCPRGSRVARRSRSGSGPGSG